jgi:putative molybdopterin biosynthesis protein
MQPELMTTAEVAAHLRLGERKVYELVQRREIPCARLTGKLLFPRRLIDLWVARHVDVEVRVETPPPVVAGSHDPLLEWALRESGSELAVLGGGSLDGLRRLADGRALLAGVHLLDPATGLYNVPVARAVTGLGDLVLVEWAEREQGLVTAPGNPLGLASLADVARLRARLVQRQEGAGAQALLRHLLAKDGLAPEDLALADGRAASETEVATRIADGEADCGLAIAAVARRLRLGFLPLWRERFDLALRRRDFFEPPLQALTAFTRGPAFAAKAAELGGYGVGGTGRIVYNA